MIRPSFFEGRGTRVMASNCSHTSRGSRLSNSDILSHVFIVSLNVHGPAGIPSEPGRRGVHGFAPTRRRAAGAYVLPPDFAKIEIFPNFGNKTER